MAFISVIIAAHNAEKTLQNTLQSLLQAMGNATDCIEVVIINDNSEDGTQRIIEEMSGYFPQLITGQVQFRNVGKVRNHALSLATGEYITMLDSDDLLKPNSLHDAVHFLRQHMPDMLLTHLLEIRDLTRITATWHGFSPISLTTNEAIRRFLVHKDFQAHLIGQFIHRDLYAQKPIPALTCYEDFAIFPTLLSLARTIYFQREGHYYYIKREGSLSSALDASKISHLVACTRDMEAVFPGEFTPLINCHWLDIFMNHRQKLTPDDREVVNTRMANLYSAAFFLSRDIRFSYKKKAVKARWKK